MFSAKTKTNQSNVTSDVITTTTLVVGGSDTSLAYSVDASYNMNIYNSLNIRALRNATTSNVVYYNTTSKEVSYGASSHGYLFYTNSTSQTITNSSPNTLKFDTTSSSRNVAITGLTYNSGTGLFTNSSGGTLFLSVHLSVAFNVNGTGVRSAYFNHSITGYLGYVSIPTAGASALTGISTTALICLLNGETFDCDCTQTSGASLGTYTVGSAPTSVSIYQL